MLPNNTGLSLDVPDFPLCRLILTVWGVITIVVGAFIFGQSTTIAVMELFRKFWISQLFFTTICSSCFKVTSELSVMLTFFFFCTTESFVCKGVFFSCISNQSHPRPGYEIYLLCENAKFFFVWCVMDNLSKRVISKCIVRYLISMYVQKTHSCFNVCICFIWYANNIIYIIIKYCLWVFMCSCKHHQGAVLDHWSIIC